MLKNVEKKSFKIDNFKFENGQELPIELGYETYGQLNEAKNNVVLVPHYFSASSHAAGKYVESDAAPGYWDALIGPGKAIDTNQYFVISTDNLANVQVHNPKVITTGPRSINPKTGKRYGMDFPVFTFKDMAKIQHEFLTTQLGIREISLIIGASAGGFIGISWIIEFPEMVQKYIGVITNPQNPSITSFSVLQHAMRAIALDPNWKNGDYEDANRPVEGLKLAIQMMNAGAFSAEFYEDLYKRDSGEQAPYTCISAPMSFEKKLAEAIDISYKTIDASHWYYTCKATMLHDAFHGYQSPLDAYARIQAKVLMVSCTYDMLQPTVFNHKMVDDLTGLGKDAELFLINSKKGHMGGVLDTDLFEQKVREFLK